MKMIDINCFVGYDPKLIAPPRTVESVYENMDASGVDSCVCYHSQSIIQHILGNEMMKKIADESNGRIAACYGVHPYLDGIQMPKAEELHRLLCTERPAAVTVFPKEQKYVFSRFYCDELLDILNELHMPIFVRNVSCDLPHMLPDLSEQYPQIKFVVVNNDYVNAMLYRQMLRKRDNVYFNAGSMVGAMELDELVNTYGADRFVFGSIIAAQNVDGSKGLIYGGRFSDADKEAIFHGNWERIQEEIRWTL